MEAMKPQRKMIIAAVIWVLAICITCPAANDDPPDARTKQPAAGQAECRDLFKRLDKAVESAGVRDVQEARVEGVPYYRANRFLASFAGELSDDEALEEWLERLLELGNQGRRFEIANLPEQSLPDLPADFASKDLVAEMERCAAQLMAKDLHSPKRIKRIQDNAAVPDEYSKTMRTVGVNPLSRWVVKREVRKLNDKARQNFQQPEAIGGSKIISYAPNQPRPVIDSKTRAEILEQGRSKSALDIPEPDPQALKQLFADYAPVWRIGTNDESDRIGRPFWQDDDHIGVDTDDPVVYRYHSFTRMREHVLLQLNYLIWFPERPSQGLMDIYSGRLDGLIWRVTLDPQGQVLLYDSLHPCGCYHKYYPVSPDLQAIESPSTPEPPLILARDIPNPEKDRVVVHVSSREHYVVGLSAGQGQSDDTVPYRFNDYATLRSLPYGDGRRSIFGPDDGLVIGTERGERWLTWPMGVRSAGAMRQRGHYPLSLIGPLHFDDARLFENVFRYEKSP